MAELTPSAVLWSQGETDYSQTVSWYRTRFRAICSRLHNGTYGMEFPALYTTFPKRPNHPSPINPAVAQGEVADERDYVYVASSLPTVLPDSVSGREGDAIHYKQTTHDWLGEAWGRSMATSAGAAPLVEHIVYGDDLGAVSELPASVECYGTSGAAYMLDAEWTEDGEGYVATLSGAPEGTEISPDLKIHATLE